MSELNKTENEFEAAANESAPGIVREFVDFLRFNKKWWLTPIFVVLLILGSFVVLSSTAVAPLIYSLF